MKKYRLVLIPKKEVIEVFNTKPEAFFKMMSVINDNNKDCYQEDEEYLTPFDFTLEEVEIKDVNEEINNGYKAAKYLKCDFISRISVTDKHEKAISALHDLSIIAEAWNKADGFVPDYSDSDQYKYYPLFEYDTSIACFVYVATHYTAKYMQSNFGSRLCFKSSERAAQFGNQFIDLWNDFLLFR